MLRLTTFGGLALSKDGTPLTGAAAQRSRLSLLALLATAGPTGFSRDKLLLHLWPESDEERARHALKQAVYSLRRELGADDVIVGTASLSLNPLIITSDAREFEAAVAAGDNAAAASLYAGPFLDGVHLKDSDEFERWSGEQRARYAHMWVSAIEHLAKDSESRGAWREAAGHWRTLASSEPLSGRLTLALVRSLAESGDLGAALQQYKIHEALLREELGTTPEPALAAFADGLRSGSWSRSPERPAKPVVTAAAVIPTDANASPRRSNPAIMEGAVGDGVAAPGRNSPPGMRVGITPARRRRRRSTALAFVLGMLLVVVAALTVTYTTMDPDERAAFNLVRTRPDARLEPRQIVVAPFENQTGDSTLDALGEQIADWFARELSEAGFNVVDARTARMGTRVVDAIPQPFRAHDRSIALGEETGSAYAVVGKYYRQGDSLLEANVSIIDVATKQARKSLGPFHGSRRNADAFIVTLLKPTITYLGTDVDTSAGGLTTKYSSPPSLETFERINGAWERFFASPRDTASVFAELDSAARLDPTYAAPLLMKAYILAVKSQWAGVDEIVRRVRPLVPRMSRQEKKALELLEADLRGDALARVAIARQLKELSPASSEMPLLMVVSALYTGQIDVAMAALKTTDPARGMNLVTPTYLEWSAEALHHSGDIAGEERTVREELKRFRHHPPATYGVVRVLATRNDRELGGVVRRGVPPAKDPNDAPRDSVGDRQDLKLLAGRELRAHGHGAAADSVFQQLSRELTTLLPAATLDQRRRQAHAFYEAKDYGRAKAAFAAIVGADPLDLASEGRLATSAAHLGDSTTVRRIDRRLATLKRPYLAGGAHRWRANIAAVEGRNDDALALLELAVRQGHRLMDTPLNHIVHVDADFVTIQKSAGFKTMLQTLAESTPR